jgi:hypothetical protein
MRDRHRCLASGRNAVDVGGFEAGIGYRIKRGVGMQLDLLISRSAPSVRARSALLP